MRKILSLLLFVGLSLHAAAQTGYPEVAPGIDSTLTRQERGRYWNHAAELAWSFLRETRSPDTAGIVLPEKLVNSLYNALIHIHNAGGIPERDSAVQCKIYPSFGISFYWTDELTIDLKKAPWAKAWQQKKERTGNAAIDKMMKEYNLKPHIRSESKRTLVVQFSTPNAAQMWTIEEQFLKMKGISKEEIMMASPDAGSIAARTDGAFWSMAYRCGASNGFNEWTLGDITWHFNVHPDGRVEYVRREK